MRLFFAILFGALTGLSYGTRGFVVKLIGHDFLPLQIVFVGFLVPFICINLFNLFRPSILKQSLTSNCYKLHIARSICAVLGFVGIFWSMRYVTLSEAFSFFYAFPLLIPLIERIWHNKPIDHKIWWGIVIGFIGLLLAVDPTSFHPGVLFAFAGGIFTGISVTILHEIRKHDDFHQTLFHFLLFATILSLIPAIIEYSYNPTPLANNHWPYLVYVGLGTFGAQVFITLAKKNAPARIVSPLFFVAVIEGVLLDIFYFHQTKNWYVYLGFGLIILGAILVVTLAKKSTEPSKNKS